MKLLSEEGRRLGIVFFNHTGATEIVERPLPATIALAGASYRGIGIPACIADGERAAVAVLAAIGAALPRP